VPDSGLLPGISEQTWKAGWLAEAAAFCVMHTFGLLLVFLKQANKPCNESFVFTGVTLCLLDKMQQ